MHGEIADGPDRGKGGVEIENVAGKREVDFVGEGECVVVWLEGMSA